MAGPARCTSDAAAATPVAAATTPPRPLLSGVRVVLVAPKTPSNVGAVARAAANFEALDLVIAAPRCELEPNGEAYKVACGSAVLDRMRVAGSLSEALADTTGSVGFTRRAGCTRVTNVSVAAMLRDFPDAVPGMRRPVAAAVAAGGGAREQQGEGGDPWQQEAVAALWEEVDSSGKV